MEILFGLGFILIDMYKYFAIVTTILFNEDVVTLKVIWYDPSLEFCIWTRTV